MTRNSSHLTDRLENQTQEGGGGGGEGGGGWQNGLELSVCLRVGAVVKNASVRRVFPRNTDLVAVFSSPSPMQELSTDANRKVTSCFDLHTENEKTSREMAGKRRTIGYYHPDE